MGNHRSTVGLAILDWYKKNKRDLPWRQTKDPYAIWISEIMLQQTRVDTVISYYKRFLEKFQTVEVLANAELDEVLLLWKGLGYYGRAKNIHKCAQVINNQFGGKFPETLEAALQLPGIGKYTAGAILSIAFNLPYPAVDGNVLRVIARIMGMWDDIAKEKTKQTVEEIVKSMMPKGEASDFTQSLMELGAMVCTPNLPKCEQCPVKALCKAYNEGLQLEIPVKTKKQPPREIGWWVAWVLKDQKLLLEHRMEESLLAGLWGLPLVEKAEGKSPEMLLQEKYGVKVKMVKSMGEVVHVFTHQRWKMDVWCCEIERGELPHHLEWKASEEFEQLTVPTAFGKVLDLGLR